MSTETKTPKFKELLESSNEQVIKRRAKIVNEQAEREMRKIVDNLKEKLSDIEMKLLDQSDVSPDSTLSTEVVKKNFNPKTIFLKIHELKVEKTTVEVELEIAKETYAEWFGE